MDKAIRYISCSCKCNAWFLTTNYKGFCCVVKDGTTKEEIIIFRPSSMPITEKIQEDSTFDEQNWEFLSFLSFTRSIAVHQLVNNMDDSIYQYVKKVLSFFLIHGSQLHSHWTRISVSLLTKLGYFFVGYVTFRSRLLLVVVRSSMWLLLPIKCFIHWMMTQTKSSTAVSTMSTFSAGVTCWSHLWSERRSV